MLAPEKVSFQIGFEDSVRVSKSQMMSEVIPNRTASMLKTTRGKSNAGTRLGDNIEVSRVQGCRKDD